MRLSFHGGAGEVTGACYLIETKAAKILIDCGLFQGGPNSADLNFAGFKFSPKEIDAVIVTHAHLDHIGRIPKLVKDGFVGRIFSTSAAKDLAKPVLEDALSLDVKDDSGRDLYTAEDLERTFTFWQTLDYKEEKEVKDIKFALREAGHILGSALVELWEEDRYWVFSGDLGNSPSVLLPPPDELKNIEYLVIESAYGDRQHEPVSERGLKLERAVEDTAARRGVLLIPAFATERTQEILHLLNEMVLFKRIPEMPVFVDSPLAIRITEVYEKYFGNYGGEIKQLFLEHPNLFRFKKLKFSQTKEESKAINDVPPPKVILAGSGMMTGGRILHHSRRYLPDPKSILLVVGYQGSGSLGRKLLEGARQVKISGEDVIVNCEVRRIEGFSAHADSEQLFNFVKANVDSLKKVFVVQGERKSADYFQQVIKDKLGITAVAPNIYDNFEI